VVGREGGAGETGVRVDPAGRGDVQDPVRPDEAEDGVQARDDGRRGRARAIDDDETVRAGVVVGGGRRPQPAIGVDGERGDVLEAGGIDRGSQPDGALDAGADVDQPA
jgi:hypothetical protein